MRLIRLKLKNIASLKGEHEIDFMEINRAGPLFAITGETGSGKSSILNAIGLALYGRIYKNVNQLDVVTLGEKEGSIELIIQVKGKYYLADWRAKVRKQNGELYSTPQTPTRLLYSISGPNFDNSKTISPIGSAELLNLDFDQFCKCIILNQGEFAKFLTSSFSERKEILEKLYPGELLESMGKELKLELDSFLASKNELEIKLTELRGDNLSGELLKDQKDKLEKELKNLEGIFQNLEKCEYHFVSLASYHEKYNENERKKGIIKSDMALETTKYNEVLKSGEVILERYQRAKKNQETESPLLQVYLKKEETLKLLQEGWINIQKRVETLKASHLSFSEKCSAKELQRKAQEVRLKESLLKINRPLEELRLGFPHFHSLFENFSEKELIQEEVKGKTERLLDLEKVGKDLKASLEEIESEIKLIPTNVKDLEKEIEEKKAGLKLKLDLKQRAEIKAQEIKKQLELSDAEIQTLKTKSTTLKLLIQKATEDLIPLETTLKLQEVLTATEICVDHALVAQTDSCPVCENQVSESKWKVFKEKLLQMDLKSIKVKFDAASKTLVQSRQEDEHVDYKLEAEMKAKVEKETSLKSLDADHSLILPDPAHLDQELDQLKKKSWKLEGLLKDLEARKIELQKTRDLYGKCKLEIGEKEKLLLEKAAELSALQERLKTLIPVINRETIKDLKLTAQSFNTYLEQERLLQTITQDEKHLLEQTEKTFAELTQLKIEAEAENKKITILSSELETTLKGEKASDLMMKLNQAAKIATDEWNRQVEEQKKRELTLKDSQGRLYQLEDLTKEYDSLYGQELQTLKEFAAKNTIVEIAMLKDLSLDFSSPKELFIPLKDMIRQQKETYKNLTNDCRMNFASVSTRLCDWEKLQDKIQLLELKAKDINEGLQRKQRLYEVLGKDELRTFVLSLVEENLIHQTNIELQKLCQGRYEIVHQTKALRMTPEFFILDKFHEGGRRKVSTLSGGETFMVSLAMSLGLAEMTRGQAEIDSLFIDEGFGTLDQDSLEDVLDMLQQIQTQGLMVGVISHIKALTQALPVNVNLQKKSDGTSSISIVMN